MDALLRRHAWRPQGIQVLACGRGPGSFTGLRSSLAFGAGWALGVEGLRLMAVGTLHAWAEAFAPAAAGEALVLLDGRRSQVYRGQLQRRGRVWTDIVEPSLVDLGETEGLAPRGAPGVSSPGAVLLTDMPAAFARHPGWTALPVDLDSAALALAVGRLACASLESGAAGPPWEPDYLRRSEAQLLWERLHPSSPAS